MSSESALEILKHFPKTSKFEAVLMATGGATGIFGGAVVAIGGQKITEELAKSAAICSGIGGVGGVLVGYVVSNGILYFIDCNRVDNLKQSTADFIKEIKGKGDPHAEKLEKLLDCFKTGLLNQEQFCDNLLLIILKYVEA
jgi:hypothetical protein